MLSRSIPRTNIPASGSRRNLKDPYPFPANSHRFPRTYWRNPSEKSTEKEAVFPHGNHRTGSFHLLISLLPGIIPEIDGIWIKDPALGNKTIFPAHSSDFLYIPEGNERKRNTNPVNSTLILHLSYDNFQQFPTVSNSFPLQTQKSDNFLPVPVTHTK